MSKLINKNTRQISDTLKYEQIKILAPKYSY